MFLKVLTTSLLAASFSVSAMAQPNLRAESTKIMDNWSGPFDALSIHVCLDRNRKSFTGSALQEAFTVEQNRIVKLLNRGDNVMAAGVASSMIKAFGHCYTVSDKQASLPTYARFMGGFLATEALAYNNNNQMQQAITLLDYAKLHGQTNTQFLNLVKEHRTAEIDTGNSEKTTLAKLSREIDNNALRFKKNYEGKSVSFDAKVLSVGYYRPLKKTRIRLRSLTGEVNKGCYVEGAMEDKAINLNKDDIITITAVVSVHETRTRGSSLQFKSCQF